MTTAATGDTPKPKPRTVTPRPAFKGCPRTCACKCGNQHCACHERAAT